MDFREIQTKQADYRQQLQSQIQRGLADAINPNDFDEPRGFTGPGFVYGNEPPKLKAEEYLHAASGWVYSAVSAIADAVMELKLRLYKTDAKGEIVEVLEHKALDLLYKVNPFMTFTDHIWLTQQYLELAGEAPWFVDRGDGENPGEPENILLIDPTKLFIKKNEDKSGMLGPVGGYMYKLNPKLTLDLRVDEVIFLKYPDPVNPWRGKGTLQAAATSVDVDNFSEEYNRRFFYNGGRPDSILTTPNKLNEKQRGAIRSDLNKLYKGVKNAQKMAILEDGLEWKPMALTGKDMEFMQQMKFSRDKILSLFRVPKSIVSITEDVNLANAKTGELIFAKWTIRPKMTRLVAQLNEFYLPMFKGTENMFLSFDDPVPEDIESNVKKYDSALGKGYMTVNEVRSELNLEDVGPDGDILLVPTNITPIDRVGEAGAIDLFRSVKTGRANNWKKGVITRSAGGYYKATRISNAVKKATSAVRQVESKIDKIVHDQLKNLIVNRRRKEKITQKDWNNEKITFGDQTLKAGDKYEDIFTNATRLIFDLQKKKILQANKAVSVDQFLLDEEDETKIMVRVYEPIVSKIVKEQGARAAYLVAQGKRLFDMQTRPVQSYLKNRIFDFSFEVNEETNKLLSEALKEGVAAGEGIPKLRKWVEDVFSGMEKYRAERIARSEVVRASNFATNEAYKQSGTVDQVEWMATADDATCEWCLPMEGRIIDLGETFFKEGDSFKGKNGGILNFSYGDVDFPPLHPSCRCTIVPVIK